MRVAPPRTLSTRVLLICAAIGVATGLLAAVAGYVSPIVFTAAPFLYGLVLASHVIPGVIAQALLRLPWVALLTHLFAAVIASAFAPQWIGRYLGTALLIGGLQEGVAALEIHLKDQARFPTKWAFFGFEESASTAKPFPADSRCQSSCSSATSSSIVPWIC